MQVILFVNFCFIDAMKYTIQFMRGRLQQIVSFKFLQITQFASESPAASLVAD